MADLIADWGDDFNWGGENLDHPSSLLDDVFGSSNGLEADLDSLLSSLTPSSSSSTHGGSEMSPPSSDNTDFQMTDILGYVLDNDVSNQGGSDALCDHDYVRTGRETVYEEGSSQAGGQQQESVEQDGNIAQLVQTAVVQDLATDLLGDIVMGEEIVKEEVETEEDTRSEELSTHSEQESLEEEEEQVEEVVVQTVKVLPQTTRKYITILPAQSKTQIALAGAASSTARRQLATSAASRNQVATVQQLTGSLAPKRRRLLQENKVVKAYPKLVLTPEEQQLCQKDGIVLPEYYPLTKSEESDLRKVRRKIRNKISAQKSRGRKKDYVDDMETRAKLSETENKQLKKKVAVLESQNRTLIDQLQRMRALLASSGSKNGHKSTALMVLLLSTALFAVPGFKEQYGGGKTELGTSGSTAGSDHFTPVVRRPTSRSLLWVPKTYPNIGGNTDSVAKLKDDTPFNREKVVQELTESLNFSRERLDRIRSGQEETANRTRLNAVPTVKAYDTNSI